MCDCRFRLCAAVLCERGFHRACNILGKPLHFGCGSCRWLLDKSHGSGVKRGLLLLNGGGNNDHREVVLRQQFFEECHSVHFRHFDIQGHDVRLKFEYHIPGAVCVAGSSNYVYFRILPYIPGQDLPEKHGVVYYQQFDFSHLFAPVSQGHVLIPRRYIAGLMYSNLVSPRGMLSA